jgi:transposase
MLVSEREQQVPSGGERRRRRVWSAEEKQRIVAETFAPGASVSVVARRRDVNANLLFTWRRQVRAGSSPSAIAITGFVPAAITAEPAAAASPAASVAAGRMEIVLASGERVVVGADVDAAALARVVEVLSRR